MSSIRINILFILLLCCPLLYSYPSIYFTTKVQCPSVGQSLMATTITQSQNQHLSIFDNSSIELNNCYHPGSTHNISFSSPDFSRFILIPSAGTMSDSTCQTGNTLSWQANPCDYEYIDNVIHCNIGTKNEEIQWIAPESGGIVNFTLIQTSSYYGPVTFHSLQLQPQCDSNNNIISSTSNPIPSTSSGPVSSSVAASSTSSSSSPISSITDIVLNEDHYEQHYKISSTMDIYWTMKHSSVEISFQSCNSNNKWIGLGFPSDKTDQVKPMIKSNAIIGWNQTISNSFIGDYYLKGKDSNEIQMTNNQHITNSKVSYHSSTNCLSIIFERPYVISGSSDISKSGSHQLIYATGPSPSSISSSIPIHTSKGTIYLDFTNGSGITKGSNKVYSLLLIHGGLMCVAWGIFIPLGILAGRFRDRITTWFLLHRVAQGVAIISALIALFFAIAGSTDTHETHHLIGWVLLAVLLFQAMNGLLRPHMPEEGDIASNTRKGWSILHKVVGISVLCVSWIQLFGGLLMIDAGIVSLGILSFVLFMWTMAWFYSFIATSKRPPQNNMNIQHPDAAEPTPPQFN